MEPQIQFIPNDPEIGANQNGAPNNQPGAGDDKKFDWRAIGIDILWALGGVFIALITYFICTLIFSGVNFYWRQIWAFVFAGLGLIGLSSAFKTKSRIAGTVGVFLFLFCLGSIINHYVKSNKDEAKDKTEQTSKPTETAKNYYPGDKPYFKLGPNQETGLINVPNNSLSKTIFYSNADFIVVPEHGNEIYVPKGSQTSNLPSKFKLKATNQEGE